MITLEEVDEFARRKYQDNYGFLNIVGVQRKDDGEVYVFIYDCLDESRKECLRTLGEFAGNPDLSFSWPDAGILSKRIEDFRKKQERVRREGHNNRLSGRLFRGE